MPRTLDFLTPVFESDGPFATILMDTGRASEDAAHAVDLRWRALAEQLTDHGAPRSVVDELAPIALGRPAHGGAEMLFAVADADRVLLQERLPVSPVPGLAGWERLPDLVPVLRLMPPRVPYLTVRIDRTGADIRGYTADALATEHVRGDDSYITKVHAGGWSEARYQRSAENTWQHNAADVADHVDRLTSRLAPELIVLCGDVRARAALLEHLPERPANLVVDLAAELGETDLAEQAGKLVAERAHATDRSVLADFEQERGRAGRACEGLRATAAALRAGQVDTLVLADHPEAPTRMMVGTAPTLLALDEAEITAAGDPPVQVRADAAMVRAAASTGARLLLVEPGTTSLDDGVGALLRYQV